MTLAVWISALAGVVTTAVIARLLMPLAHTYGLLDRPSGRHDHAAPTPVVGGIAIWLAIAVIGLAGASTVTRGFLGYLAAGAVLIGAGVLDDLRNLPWHVRLFVQALAATFLIVGGTYASSIGNLLELGAWALPFSVFATIGLINAVNMIDGSDGLSGTLVGIALAFFAIEAAQAGDHTLAGHLVLMLGCVGGFLWLNLRFKGQPAARIFLGNSGSALLGLTVAWGAFELASIPGHRSAGILAPWVLAIPLIDCIVVIVRRLRAGRSPVKADRHHIHHVLRDAGYTPQRIVALAALTTLIAGSTVKLWLSAGWPELPLVLVFLLLIGLHFVWSGRREHAVTQRRREPRVVFTHPARSVSMPQDPHD